MSFAERSSASRSLTWAPLSAAYQVVMNRLREWGVFFTLVYARRLPPSAGSPPDGVVVQLADRQLLAPYAETTEYMLSSSFLDEAFAREDECVATLVDGRLAAYGWVGYGSVPHTADVWIEFSSGYRYNYKSFTHPDFRGQHLRGSFGVLANRDRAEEVTHSICFIESHNFASTRAEVRNGGMRVGIAGFVRVFGHVLSFRSPGARRVGFRFRPHAIHD